MKPNFAFCAAMRKSLAQANVALTAANGKSKVTWSTSSPGTAANSAGDIWFVTGVGGGVIAQWQGQGGTTWVSQPIQDSVITSITAAKLTTGSLGVGNEIIAGNPSGSNARMTSTGFKVFVNDPVDGVPNEVVRMGSDTDDTLAVSNLAGEQVASIDEEGRVIGSGASLGSDSGPIYATDSNGDVYLASGVELYGTEFQTGWYDPLPKGVIAFGYRTTSAAASTTEAPYQQVDATLEYGRMYRIGAKGWGSNTAAGGRCYVRLRFLINSGAAQTNSTILRTTMTDQVVAANANEPWELMHHYARSDQPSGTYDISTLITYAPSGGSASFIYPAGTDSSELWIEDLGPYYGDVGIDRSGGTPPPTKKTYTSSWVASTSESYNGSNGARTDTTDLVQGYNSFNGDGHAVVIFGAANSTGSETGKSIATALSGATLSKAEVYLYANHWYYNSGGTAIIRAYNSTSLSSATPTGTTKQSSGWPKPGGRWVDITSIATTAIRGITLGKSGGTNLLYYGRFNYQGNSSGKPTLRLTYIR